MILAMKIFGILLLLFGGGCTLLFAIVGIPFGIDSTNYGESQVWGDLIGWWLFGGLFPLFGGFFLFRYGMKRDREKGMAAQEQPTGEDKS